MLLDKSAAVIDQVCQQVPLIHSLTNYVTINDCANILLSYGASPAMVEAFDETYGFANISSALYINLGTLTKEQEAAAYQAILGARAGNTPVIIDPVAVGALPRKRNVFDHLLELGEAKVVKGNGGEILALAGDFGSIRGVDAVGDLNGLEKAAVASMGIAGELASEKASLPASFRIALIDSIYQLSSDIFKAKGRIHVESF